MAQKHSARYRKGLTLSLIAGLIALTAYLVYLWRNQPEKVIRREFKRAGVSPKLTDLWVAVAKHETAGFTSRVFREGRNMFGMTLPKGTTLAIGKLPYGEGQAIFKNLTDSARDQVLYFTRRFSYPTNITTAESLVDNMAKRGYFTSDPRQYLEGVKRFL